MGTAKDLMDIGDGVRSAVTDAPSLVGNIATGDVHGAVTDGRNLLGDVTGVAQGLHHLGVHLGQVPARYLGAMAKLADSAILAAAQLVIESEKALTGSGDPDAGGGLGRSADRLEHVLKTVVRAAPQQDQWDGSAAEAYRAANDAHRRSVSATQTADTAIAAILGREADQVIRTRRTLDETSQYLYDFGLTTAWMNFVPPLAPAKAALDMAAAAAALGVTTLSMQDLAGTSLHGARQILRAKEAYHEALTTIRDTAGTTERDDDTSGLCGTLIPQKDDLADRPSRIADPDTYTIPDIDFPWGPPATPYTKAPAPQTSSRATRPRPPGIPPGTGAGRAPLRDTATTPRRKGPDDQPPAQPQRSDRTPRRSRP